MFEIQIQLASLWTATMLVYLLGDVIRIFAGDAKPGEIMGKKMPKLAYLGIAALMVIPILMVLASIFLPVEFNRPLNIFMAGFFIVFNLLGFKDYEAYDKFLLIVSFVFNGLTIWVAWNLV